MVSADEGEDYYEIRLSYRPAGRFAGEPGLEQFTIDKLGSIELRQILDEPRAKRSISMLVLAIIGVIVVVGAAGGVLFAAGVVGGGDGGSAAEVRAPTPTVQPSAQAAAALPTSTARPVSAVATAATPTPGPSAGGQDFVQVGSIDPPGGAEVIAGTTIFVTAEVAYDFVSQGAGEVALLIQVADQRHDDFASVTVAPGSGVITVEGSFVVPDRSGTEVRVHLRGPGGAFLVDTLAATYKIVQQPGSLGPEGDEVEIAKIDPPEGAVLIKGELATVTVDIGYGLVSQSSGEVALLATGQDGNLADFATGTVARGAGGLTVTGSFPVPDRSGTDIVVQLRGRDGSLLAEVFAGRYSVGTRPVRADDNLILIDIDPPGGTPLEPGTGVDITAVVEYTLSSQASGFVRLGYVPSDGGFSQIAEQPVGLGRAEITFHAGLTVPDQPTTLLVVSLVGADGRPILNMEIAAYSAIEVAAQPSPARNARQGGGLRIALGGDPAPNGLFDYYTRNSRWLLQAISPAFNGLVEQDPQDPYNIVPGLAERWDIGSDGTGWTFTLRPGVRFHDGSSLDVTDFAMTLEFISANGTTFVKDDLFRILGPYDVIDDLTIGLFLDQPFAAFLPVLSQGFMNVYPSEVMREALDSGFPGDPRVALTGTGPFRLSVYAPGEVLQYERWPFYFVGDRPYLDQLDMFIIPDGATRIAALQTGQIDLSLERLTPDESAGLSNQGFPVSTGPLMVARAVNFNTQAGPWREPPVRRAASVAIDRAVIRDVLLGGQGGEGSFVPPWGPWVSQPVAYDPDRAKRLLAEAGFPDGFTTTMTVAGLPDRVAVAEIVAKMWSQVGIETELEVMDFSAWADRLRAGEYSTTIVGFALAVDDPDVILRRLYASDGGANFTGFSSIDFDNILAAQATTADLSERHSKVASLQSILADLSPSTVVYWDDMRQGIRPDVKDYFLPQSLHARVNFANVWLDR